METSVYRDSNRRLIETFYQSFAAGQAEPMVACYADEVEFSDPVFPRLRGEEARSMWRMLLLRARGLKVEFSEVQADEKTGSALWVATYHFARTGRPVVNRIRASFEFKDGKIVRHQDAFDFWKWSRQALGLPGLLLGWSPLIRNKVRAQAAQGLSEFRAQTK